MPRLCLPWQVRVPQDQVVEWVDYFVSSANWTIISAKIYFHKFKVISTMRRLGGCTF